MTCFFYDMLSVKRSDKYIENKDFTFLTNNQLSDNKIDIIKKRGRKAAITDFSILLGGCFNDECYINSDTSLEGRAGRYWTKTPGEFKNGACLVIHTGNVNRSYVYQRYHGARPALPFSSISNIPTNGVSGGAKKSKDGILEVEYGYYPQKAVSKSLQTRLEQAYKDGNIKKTGNKYTTDSRRYDEYYETFSKRELEEFEFEGHRYVRVEANLSDKRCILSNGENYNYGDIVWVEVSPVKWLVDEKEKIMLSDKILFAGVQFKHTGDYDGNFEETDIKSFMDNYFSKEITAGKESIMKLGDNPEFKEDVTSIVSCLEEIVSDLKKENENLKQELEQTKQELKETKELIISMRNIFKQMGNIEQNHVETQEQTKNTY